MFAKHDWISAFRQWPTSTVVGWLLGLLAAWVARMIGIPALDQLQWPALTGLGYLIIFFASSFLFIAMFGLARRAFGDLGWPTWSASGSGPAYWTLTEAVSWIAFGEPVSTKHWSAFIRRTAIGLMEERHRFYVAERALFEKLRNPDSSIDVQGKDAGEGLHKPIPPNVFLSNVGASILDDSLGMPHEADIGTILHWDGPKWTDVRIRRAHVLRHWKSGLAIPTVSDDLARFILETRPIMDELQDHDAMPPLEAIQGWRNRVTDYIRDNMGREYEARFTEPRSFSDEELGPLGRNPVNTLKVGLQHRISLLYQFIEEAKAK